MGCISSHQHVPVGIEQEFSNTGSPTIIAAQLSNSGDNIISASNPETPSDHKPSNHLTVKNVHNGVHGTEIIETEEPNPLTPNNSIDPLTTKVSISTFKDKLRHKKQSKLEVKGPDFNQSNAKRSKPSKSFKKLNNKRVKTINHYKSSSSEQSITTDISDDSYFESITKLTMGLEYV